MLWPNGSKTQPTVTSAFGPRKPVWTPNGWSSSLHRGVDFVGFRQVKSISDGVVERVGVVRGWEGGGQQVWVRNSDGSLARYFHLSSYFVAVGNRVAEGQDLGIMGMTGTASGIHLHLEIVPKGQTVQVDPVLYIRARLSSTAGGGGNVTPIPPSTGDLKGDDVFVISNNIPGHPQKGAAWIAVPQGNGQPRATVLFGGDNFPGVPVIQFVNKGSWDAFSQGIQWA